MRGFSLVATLVALATASPTRTVEKGATANVHKRATISDAATLGYASQNGG